MFKIYDANIFFPAICVGLCLWYFLPYAKVVFKVFYMTKTITLFFYAFCFWVMVGKVPSSSHKGIPSMFSSKSTVISHFTFRYLIYLEFILLYSMRFGFSFIFFQMTSQFFRYNLFQSISFSYWFLMPPLSCAKFPHVLHLFLFCFIGVSVQTSVPLCFD